MKAFPQIYESEARNNPNVDLHEGMDLRDYFAAKAMYAEMILCADLGYKKVAERSYEMADAMMEARNDTP